MEPKTIVVFSCIFLIFVLALLIPHIKQSHRDPFRRTEIDDLLDDVLGEEGNVTYTQP